MAAFLSRSRIEDLLDRAERQEMPDYPALDAMPERTRTTSEPRA
jgi:hypothetical protein